MTDTPAPTPDPCPDCGYDRTGLGEERPCPECGYVQSADEVVVWGEVRHIGENLTLDGRTALFLLISLGGAVAVGLFGKLIPAPVWYCVLGSADIQMLPVTKAAR